MEIWYADIGDLSDTTEDILMQELPGDMANEIRIYKKAADRRCRLASRLIIKKYCLEKACQVDLHSWTISNSGKPSLPGAPFFSISHSGNMAVVAFDNESEIGIDIEQIREFNPADILHFFHPEEISLLSENGNDTEMFYTIWTRKEALLKATGQGLLKGLDKVCVLEDLVVLEKAWNISSVEITGKYKCAVCFYNSVKSITDIRRMF